MFLDLRVVLVRTIYDRNIGSTSRAMSNMDCDQLILVDPKCEITYEAQQAAATGQVALQGRVTYSTWSEFFAHEPASLKIAFTARDGRGRQVQDWTEILNQLKQSPQIMRSSSNSPTVVHLIFGPEDVGLAASDLEFVNVCATIPTFGKNWSLNLSQAVLLALYTLRLQWGGQRTLLDGGANRRVSDHAAIAAAERLLHDWLLEMGFDLSKKKINAFTVLRRMLLQNTPTTKELNLLTIVLQQSRRKLREWNELKGRD